MSGAIDAPRHAADDLDARIGQVSPQAACDVEAGQRRPARTDHRDCWGGGNVAAPHPDARRCGLEVGEAFGPFQRFRNDPARRQDSLAHELLSMR